MSYFESHNSHDKWIVGKEVKGAWTPLMVTSSDGFMICVPFLASSCTNPSLTIVRSAPLSRKNLTGMLATLPMANNEGNLGWVYWGCCNCSTLHTSFSGRTALKCHQFLHWKHSGPFLSLKYLLSLCGFC